MAKKDFRPFKPPAVPKPIQKPVVDSLLDSMRDGDEYASLLDVSPAADFQIRDELRKAIADVEAVRNRPLLVYVGNTVNQKIVDVPTGIVLADDLPFAEMVGKVPDAVREIDVMVVTPGGIAQQVAQFVSRLRPRFDHVAYLLPYVSMSAGTIWVMSGDEIIMDERASLGPIDPQVPGRDGRLLPAQALLGLIETIRERGDERIKQGGTPAWTDQMLLRNMDAKEIGNAHSSSNYSIQLAATYLEMYKLKSWINHQNGSPVDQTERKTKAAEIASKLCDHGQWKTHSHGISRDVAWTELKLKISHPDPGLERAMRRLWALFFWLFDNSLVAKVIISQQYSIFRSVPTT